MITRGKYEASPVAVAKRGTKNAQRHLLRTLVSSIVSMILCLTMFLSTTMAWFTDTVTSAGNQITVGELKVDVLYNEKSLKETSTPIFGGNVVWRPGHLETRVLVVENKGNLDMKYTLNLLLQTDAADNVADIANYIKVYANVVGADFEPEKADLSMVKSWNKGPGGRILMDIMNEGISVLDGQMKAPQNSQNSEVQYVAISLYMVEDVPSSLQGKTVKMNIKLNAYQSNTPDSEMKDPSTYVSSEDQLRGAIAEGGKIVLTKDIEMDADTTVAVESGKTVTLDLNGNTLSLFTGDTGSNREMFLVKGNMTVKNGMVTMKHTGTNMAWSAMNTVFDVTAGGVLNLKDVTVENQGGTDMNFCVHLNNWGEVTLNVEGSTLKAAYIPVRVFNSGSDKNNVTIKNSDLIGGSVAFWVHNYTAADFGAAYNEAEVNERLNFNIFGNGNTFTSKNNPDTPVLYGFTDGVYLTADGTIVTATVEETESAPSEPDVSVPTEANVTEPNENAPETE